MSKKRYILHEEIADIVEAARIELGLIDLSFFYGTPDELLNDLNALSKDADNAATKYPLVYLPLNVIEEHTEDNSYYYTVSLNLLIATSAQQEWDTEERYENSFNDTLQPIYEEILNQIVLAVSFDEQDDTLIEHEKTDNIYWGRNHLMSEDYQSLEFIDVIEITNMKLKLKYKNC